jgi:hypothetical protein
LRNEIAYGPSRIVIPRIRSSAQRDSTRRRGAYRGGQLLLPRAAEARRTALRVVIAVRRTVPLHPQHQSLFEGPAERSRRRPPRLRGPRRAWLAKARRSAPPRSKLRRDDAFTSAVEGESVPQRDSTRRRGGTRSRGERLGAMRSFPHGHRNTFGTVSGEKRCSGATSPTTPSQFPPRLARGSIARPCRSKRQWLDQRITRPRRAPSSARAASTPAP